MNMNPNTQEDTLSFFLFIPNCIALEKFKLIWVCGYPYKLMVCGKFLYVCG